MTDEPQVPLSQIPVVFLDVETTGLDADVHEIMEIAVVDIEGRTLIDTKVKPTSLETASEEALKINGYADHPELWENAPTFKDIHGDVLGALEGKVIVGQCPYFDRDFVVAELDRCGVGKAYRKVKRHVIGTETLAWEHLVPCGLDNLSLAPICKFLGVPLERSERHSALHDARAARGVYLMLLRADADQRKMWVERAVRKGLIDPNHPAVKPPSPEQ
jgi:DNA polymerase-3 subunit epsilon